MVYLAASSATGIAARRAAAAARVDMYNELTLVLHRYCIDSPENNPRVVQYAKIDKGRANDKATMMAQKVMAGQRQSPRWKSVG